MAKHTYDRSGASGQPRPPVAPDKRRGRVKHSGMTTLYDFNVGPIPPEQRRKGIGGKV